MAKYVTRTFITSVIHGVSVHLDGNNWIPVDLDDIVVDGKIDDDKAAKALKKAYPNESNVLVKGVEYKTELRGMTVEDFKVNSIVMPEKGSADVDADEAEAEPEENY